MMSYRLREICAPHCQSQGSVEILGDGTRFRRSVMAPSAVHEISGIRTGSRVIESGDTARRSTPTGDGVAATSVNSTRTYSAQSDGYCSTILGPSTSVTSYRNRSYGA